MKFIPLESFALINSLLQGVEAQGCLRTVRLEAFTCRRTNEERQIANDIANYHNTMQSTPPISPSPAMTSMFQMHGAGSMPPPLVLGSSAPDTVAAVTADTIDDRLVYLVAALNSLYGEDGYDFSVLKETDFISHTEATVRGEMALVLQAVPESCGPAVAQFWAAIENEVLNEAHGCEYYEFRCPECDPLRERTLFSTHYFLYNRRRKVLVSLLSYGEGNMYRGDDGYIPPDGTFTENEEYERMRYMSSPEPLDEYEEHTNKNRHFYGY